MTMQSETKERQPQLVLDGSAEASGSSSSARVDQKETALVGMSMLFELIRESTLCVTWQSDAKKITNNVDGSSSGGYSSRRSEKRRRPSSSADITSDRK